MKHIREFDPRYGKAVELAPGLRRLTANNPGPFTFRGTNTYLLGMHNLAVLDPGPADIEHIRAIIKETDGAKVEAILVSHTHMDHSPGARILKNETGAPIVGCGVHRPSRDLLEGEINPLDSSGDKEHVPDLELQDGDIFDTADFSLEAVSTPGHTVNHICLALRGESILFSADHVMGWSTSIVAPPDGSMRDYMASVDKLLQRSEDTYFPGHGAAISDALAYVSDLRKHRLDREAAILEKLAGSPATIPQIVAALYAELDPALHSAAGLSVFAHLEDLADRYLVSASPGLALSATYTLAG